LSPLVVKVAIDCLQIGLFTNCLFPSFCDSNLLKEIKY